jgi:transposase InsO family protein
MKNHEEPGWQRALWRYQCVSQVEVFVLAGKTLAEAVTAVSKVPRNGAGRVSRSSLYRWYEAFQSGGIEALFDQPRPNRKSCLSENFLLFLQMQKKDDPEASIPEIIARAVEQKIIEAGETLDRTTVYRAARSFDLPMFRRARAQATAMRPYSYEHRMMMVLSDGKHFRAGVEKRKRVAMFFIDDATRYVLDVFVGTSEDTDLFLRGLFRVVQNYGRMSVIYIDHGPGFIADDSAKVCANLKIPIIHGTVAYPEGHAKIERFHGTVTQALLRGLQKPEIDPSCTALELRLRHYIRERYNRHHHSGINSLPEERFYQDTRELNFPESSEELEKAFVLSEPRKVRRDNVISWNGVIYETPLGYGGRWVTIYRNVLCKRIWMLHNGEAFFLQPPDLGLNAREKRLKIATSKLNEEPITTAAEMHFNRDFSPIVGIGGDFSHNSHQQKEQK